MYSLLINIYKLFLKGKEVDLQAITLSLAVRDRSIQEGGLFKRAVLSRAYGNQSFSCSDSLITIIYLTKDDLLHQSFPLSQNN